jgi:ribonuclease PH
MSLLIDVATRNLDELRRWTITEAALDYPEGSALIQAGNTRVLCAASVEERVPPFMRNEGRGWVTAEYSMLPRSTHTRTARERGGRIGGRTMEIQRLIGRSLRAVTSLEKLGERTITVDCDVIQADGGTRTAAITAAWVALHMAVSRLQRDGLIETYPLNDSVAAVSVGIVDRKSVLDLDYSLDSHAEVDMNVVMTGTGKLVEVQATAEREPFTLFRLNSLVKLAALGIAQLTDLQREAIARIESATKE